MITSHQDRACARRERPQPSRIRVGRAIERTVFASHQDWAAQ
jgi:hypothetical protein